MFIGTCNKIETAQPSNDEEEEINENHTVHRLINCSEPDLTLLYSPSSAFPFLAHFLYSLSPFHNLYSLITIDNQQTLQPWFNPCLFSLLRFPLPR